MDSFSLSSTAYYSPSTPFSTSVLAGKHHSTAISTSTTTPLTLSYKPTSESDSSSSYSAHIRRPNTHKPLKTISSDPTPPIPKPSSNPLKNLVNPTNSPPKSSPQSQNLTSKLWLSSKLCPPPPPPLPPPPLPLLEGENAQDSENETFDMGKKVGSGELPGNEFRQEGKIFVGNLPLWIKKNEVSEFFRQFGPIKNVILIKGHHDIERNMGFGFVLYGGSAAVESAMKAVEFDGVEFHGRVLTVKLDDGRRMKTKSEERARWVEGDDGEEFRSKWHEEREGSRREFKRVLETHPENWQAVVRAFERIKKV